MPYTQEELNQYIESDLLSEKNRFSSLRPLAVPALAIASTAFGPGFWRRAHGWAQHVEGATPMGMGATFRLSEFISPLAAPDNFVLSASQYSKLFSTKDFQEYISKTSGVRITELQKMGAFEKGFEWSRTGKATGTLSVLGGPTLTSNASLLFTGPRRQGTILEWFGRVSGVENPGFLRSIEETDDLLRPQWMPIAAQSKKALAGKFAYGAFSWAMGRMNLLLQSPFDLEIMEDMAKKTPFLGKLRLGVKTGTGLEMLARYTGKAGLALGAYHALKYSDYLARDWGPLGAIPVDAAVGAGIGLGIGWKTGGASKKALIGAGIGAVLGLIGPFRHGPIAGSGDLYSKVRVAQASISKTFGLQSGAQRAEEMFPGINKPTTLIGMAGAGLLIGGAYEWGSFMNAARKISGQKELQPSGAAARGIYEVAERAIKEAKEAQYLQYADEIKYQSGIGKAVTQFKQRFFSGSMRKGEFTPAGAGRYAAAGALVYSGLNAVGSIAAGDVLGGIVQAAATVGAAFAYAKKGGAAMAGVLALPFLLREKEDPEHLRRIYSGEEDVAIKAGRQWEAGRCNTYTSLITLNEKGDKKPAGEIRIDDTLLGADGKAHKIIQVYKRNYKGSVLKIATVIDRNLESGLTPNHKVPIIHPSYKYSSKTGTYWHSKDNCSIELVNAEDIEIGDFVQIPKPFLLDQDETLVLSDYIKSGHFIESEDKICPAQINWATKKIQKSQGFQIPKSLNLSDDFGRLIGYFLAEGNLSFNGKPIPSFIEMVFGFHEEWILDDIKDICWKLFGIVPTVRFKNTDRKAIEGCWIIRICSSLLARVFFHIFYESNREKDKSIPDICFRGTRSYRKNIILGYWRGDGHLDRGRNCISSSRYSFIEMTRTLLLEQDKYPTCPKVEVLKEKKKNGDISVKYRIGWNEEDKTKVQSFAFIEGKIFAQVISIKEEDYDGEVFDFEIDHPEHLLQNGTFLVHNSSYEGKRPYWRPHRVAMMKKGVQAAALTGSERAYWDSDPIFNPVGWLWNPYKREELMWERGYKFPMTKTPFEDFPVLGPVLAATVGRILKPPKFMGRDQWMPDPAASSGPYTESPMEEPISRVGLKGTIGEQLMRLQELSGMPGFALSSIKGAITGEESFFPADQWATPSLVSGMEPGWWSLEMGGLGLLCIEENSIVQAERGCIPIKDIVPGDRVISRDGTLKTVLRTSSRKESNLITLKIAGLDVELKASGNHIIPIMKGVQCHSHSDRICIPNRGKYCKTCSRRVCSIETEDVPVDTISAGDFVEVSLPINLYEEPVIDLSEASKDRVVTDKYIYLRAGENFAKAFELLEQSDGQITGKELRDLSIPNKDIKEAVHRYRRRAKPKRFARRIKLSKELAYFLGWYAAEGSLSKNSVQLSMASKEKNYAIGLGESIKNLLGTNYGVFPNGENGIATHFYSTQLRDLCFLMVGKGSKTKEVSHLLMNSSKEIRAAFLRGYMLGDGYCNPEKKKSGISTSSRILAIQSLLIGLSLGFHGHLCLDYLEKGGGKYPQGTIRKDTLRSYVCWAKETVNYLPQFLLGEIQELPPHGKKKAHFVFDGKAYFQVKKVSSVQEESTVCDLEIEDLHYFTAEFLTVHNSEGIRRYIPHKRSDVDYRNPLPSGLPSWLPSGERYFLDFSRADIYSKIKEPWARLPGPGLAELNPELKGVSPEEYSPFWRFKVLASLAPWSYEYGIYSRMTSSMAANEQLTAKEILEVQRIKKQVAKTKRPEEFDQYRYSDDAVEKKSVKILGEVEPGLYMTDTFGKAPVRLAGVDTSQLSVASELMTRDSRLTAQEAISRTQGNRAQVSDYLRQYLYPGAQVDVFVHKDPSLMIEMGESGTPEIQGIVESAGRNVNRELIERGLASKTDSSVVLDSGAGVSPIQRGFGAFWERLMHGAETPLESFTPFAPVAKFIHQRTALEEYQRSEVYGREIAMWQKPISHFLAPGLYTTAWWGGWRGMPTHVKQRYMIEEYFDKLQYMKSDRLEKAELARGAGEAAAQYTGEKNRTKTGADKYSQFQILRAISSKEKAYFNEFVNSPTASERDAIAQVVSPQMRSILQAQWQRKAAQAAEMRMESGIGERQDSAIVQRYWRNWWKEQNRDVSAELQNMPVPKPSFIGFDPNADLEDVKVKTVLETSHDYHDFGIWRSDIERTSRRPWISSVQSTVSDTSHVPPSGMTSRISALFNANMGRIGRRHPNISMTSGPFNHVNVSSPGYDRLERYMGDPSIMQF